MVVYTHAEEDFVPAANQVNGVNIDSYGEIEVEGIKNFKFGKLKFDIFVAEEPIERPKRIRNGSIPTSKCQCCLEREDSLEIFLRNAELLTDHGSKSVYLHTCPHCQAKYILKVVKKLEDGYEDDWAQREPQNYNRLKELVSAIRSCLPDLPNTNI